MKSLLFIKPIKMTKIIDCPADIIRIILKKSDVKTIYYMSLMCKKFAYLNDILTEYAKTEFLDQIKTQYIDLACYAFGRTQFYRFNRTKFVPGYHHYYKRSSGLKRINVQKYKSLCKKLKLSLNINDSKYLEFDVFLTSAFDIYIDEDHIYKFHGMYKIIKKFGRSNGNFVMYWNSENNKLLLFEEDKIVTEFNIEFGKQTQKALLDTIKDFFYGPDKPKFVTSWEEFNE